LSKTAPWQTETSFEHGVPNDVKTVIGPTSLSTIYPIKPVPKPRPRLGANGNVYVPRSYKEFKGRVQLYKITIPDEGATVTFVVPMPKSWSKKRRKDSVDQPHRSTPDVDNFLKALLDACFADDAHIWDIRARKIWGEAGQIIIEV
jgi:Holliday junction resolvase RusA-like endonuclease